MLDRRSCNEDCNNSVLKLALRLVVGDCALGIMGVFVVKVLIISNISM